MNELVAAEAAQRKATGDAIHQAIVRAHQQLQRTLGQLRLDGHHAAVLCVLACLVLLHHMVAVFSTTWRVFNGGAMLPTCIPSKASDRCSRLTCIIEDFRRRRDLGAVVPPHGTVSVEPVGRRTLPAREERWQCWQVGSGQEWRQAVAAAAAGQWRCRGRRAPADVGCATVNSTNSRRALRAAMRGPASAAAVRPHLCAWAAGQTTLVHGMSRDANRDHACEPSSGARRAEPAPAAAHSLSSDAVLS